MEEYTYNVKCICEYDGANYKGFQIQHDDPTIELALIKAIKYITKENVKIYASGRTDKDVHAVGQVFNFYTNFKENESRFMYAINRMLPSDIKLKSLEYVDMSFHSRFSAKSKEYRYYIRYKNYSVFQTRYSLFKEKLSLSLMDEAIKCFLGTHDFTAFCSSDVDERKSCVKTITKAEINDLGDTYEFIFEGTGFLKYQIRRMMAILIAIGLNKEKKETIYQLYESKSKQMKHRIAPGCGLYLYKVNY